jgi:nucleotide-binding universal stress UspA family protein
MIHKRILVPLNLGAQSDIALKYAVKLASAMKGMISCLHVNEEPDVITEQFLTREISSRIRRQAEESLSAKAHEVLNADSTVPYEIIVTRGKVHRKVREKAKDLDASLIIMARSDAEDLHDGEIGSNTLRVLTKAHIPVLTVSGATQLGNDPILLPLDLSNQVEVKILKAIELARMLGVEVRIISVLKPGWISLKSKYQRRLKEIQQLFGAEGVSCKVQLLVSDDSIPEKILQYSKKINAGMIMVMTRQEKRDADFFIGSTAHQIIQRSDLPVLSIIPEVSTHALSDAADWSSILHPISKLQMN